MYRQAKIVWLLLALLTNPLHSQETTVVYSADKPIWDLRNFNDATNMSAYDDGTSQAFGLGFDFTFFGQSFDKAYMASNGCLILGALSTANNWEGIRWITHSSNKNAKNFDASPRVTNMIFFRGKYKMYCLPSYHHWGKNISYQY